ncbi:MAG: alpha/beta hydrolase [Bdellovibrionales bacterium]|nr:alpha/beta hydrolase [Oligoflexia bacterium]
MAKLNVDTENNQNIELYYQDMGKGKPVVLIHGWPLSGRSWEAQIPALIDSGFRVITYDRRGFGQSSQPWNGYDYDTFAKDLNSLIEHLDLKEAALVGFSMGGGEVVRYIAKFGTARVVKAVLAGAVPPFLHKSKENPAGAIDNETVHSFQNAIKKDRIAFLDAFVTNFFTANKKDLASPEQHQYNLSIANAASPKGTLDCISAFTYTDFRADLQKISVPTLIIHGDSDGIVPFEASGKLAHEQIKGSQLCLIKGGPHGMNTTHAEEFNKNLISFLKDK